jgi:uncharacterized protein
MKLSDTVHIPAPPEKVWLGLNDPDTLKAAIPGCKSIEKVSDTEFKASAAVAFGPVKATFGGKVTLSDLDPPNGYKISGEGTGGPAGFAKGSAVVRLTPKDGGTDLSYEVEASVGGKIAQIGQRFIDQAAKKLADDFFGRFASAVAPTEAAPEAKPDSRRAGAAIPAPQPAAATMPAPAAAPSPALAAPQRAADTPGRKTRDNRPTLLIYPDPADRPELTRALPRKLIVLGVIIALIVLLIIYQR